MDADLRALTSSVPAEFSFAPLGLFLAVVLLLALFLYFCGGGRPR